MLIAGRKTDEVADQTEAAFLFFATATSQESIYGQKRVDQEYGEVGQQLYNLAPCQYLIQACFMPVAEE
jgi:hypothetical protein